jgi:SWI/SNF-related matrix-associated actin-dependent regulator of chromatin subfamily A member 5
MYGNSLTVDDDIDKIIREGEERTAVLNKKYEGMNLDALTNFQPELDTRTWEGQNYGGIKVSALRNIWSACNRR